MRHISVSAAILAACSGSALGQNAPRFPSPTFPWAGIVNSSGAVIADVTGDGKADLVACNGATQLHLFPGDGAGNFTGPNVSSSGTGSLGPSGLAVGDLNGDSAPDVVFTNQNNDTMSVLTNSGTGAFSVGTPMTTGVKPKRVRLRDFNLDGKLDAVTVNELGNNATVLLGNGVGGFAPGVNFSVGSLPQSVDTADFNLDGRPDFVTANLNSDNLSVRLGDGFGSFGANTNFSVFDRPSSVSAGDVNGDGSPDIVAAAATFSPGFVYTRLGNGIGGFGSSQNTSTANQLTGIVLLDANADGKLDFAATSNAADVLVLGSGAGNGAFPTLKSFPCDNDPQFVSAGDVDGNGRTDLVVVSIINDLQVFRSDGGSSFLSATAIATGTSPSRVALCDLDQDGFEDALVAAASSSSVNRFFGNGDGSLTIASTVSGGGLCRDIVAADFNGDHKIDFATANGSTNTSTVALGVGGGAFGSIATFAMGADTRSVIAGDWNLDGKTDLAASCRTSNEFVARLGDGLGGFGASFSFPVLDSPSDAVGADFDRDGDVDLAVAVSAKEVRVLLCDGLGGFGGAISSTIHASSAGSTVISSGDADGDGLPDLAVDFGISGVGWIAVLRGTGAGTFVATFSQALSTPSRGVTLADVDGDGRDDLLTSNTRIQYYAGNGLGGFTRVGSYGTGGPPGPTAVGDLDLDGLPDLVTPNPLSSSMAIHRNLPVAPAGVSSYGTGTSGCRGRLGFTAAAPATLGSTTFGFNSTNSPPSVLGLCVVGDAADFPGSDPFFLNLTLHVDFFGSSGLLALDALSDAWGTGYTPLLISPNPVFLGATFYAQVIFVEPASYLCSAGFIGLVSSKGVQFTVQ
ncbi:MAG: VCBS repeat-containing protein [Planctomycetes bacterium]|nr:VCBS repeat-containing protein [Planctomycetota bacterium]